MDTNSTQTPQNSPSTKPTILVIDDDMLLRTSMVSSLSQAGYNVLEAENATTGISAALSNHPALIITDYQMPDASGVDVIEKLRADSWGQHVPIVLATNVYDLTLMNSIMALNVRDYVLKSDMSLEQIAAIVGKYVPLTA